MSKKLALAVAVIAGVLVISRWGTPEAIAWTVAFCGWLPHAFQAQEEATHGEQA